ncbi:MAG: hypothetical protein A2234_06285 [Elusimicrobia bacterium RIFOXYA2_FULL_58_8]|nr:MAG: hypothetical protein A2285_07600 [Elusimicrobia bacterium RIFOXYA12_FULL_57_11]OGS17411.1 MAG: hypothetical protein A2234_06285 [Elusimicrobia bacterium RIFOXYA2_FULL_58_8]
MIIFWRLFLAHLLADFTLQFDVINRMKRKNVWGVVLHCLTHLVVSVALTWNYLSDTWVHLGPVPVNGWWALVIMLVSHFGIDQVRIFSIKRLHYKDGTLSFIVDQVLHVYVLFMISPLILPGESGLLAEKWTGMAAMFVLVTHVSTVLIYFIEKEFFGKNFPGFDEKYFLIFERLVLWLFFLVDGRWWVPFALAWILQIFYVRKKRLIDLSRLNVALSIFITCSLGLWARYIYYGSLWQ